MYLWRVLSFVSASRSAPASHAASTRLTPWLTSVLTARWSSEGTREACRPGRETCTARRWETEQKKRKMTDWLGTWVIGRQICKDLCHVMLLHDCVGGSHTWWMMISVQVYMPWSGRMGLIIRVFLHSLILSEKLYTRVSSYLITESVHGEIKHVYLTSLHQYILVELIGRKSTGFFVQQQATARSELAYSLSQRPHGTHHHSQARRSRSGGSSRQVAH